MPKRGTFYAITTEEAERLLSLAGNDADLAKEALDLYTFERQRAHFITPVDKTWDPIHRCLSDGTLRNIGAGNTPLSQCVLGARHLPAGAQTIVCFIAADQVPQISEALQNVEIHWFISKFSSLGSHGYTGAINREELEFAWEYFTNIRNLYERAAVANRAIVFVAD
jgi:hypothetical protein